MTVNTELAKDEIITVSLQSQGGFSESVNVAPSLVNAQGQPIMGITVMGPTSVAVAANGTTPAQYTVRIPTDATGVALAATLKLDVTSSLGTTNLTSTINVAPIYTISINAGTGASDPNHPLANKVFSVRRGTKLRMVNNDTVEHISHGGGGIPHQAIQPGVTGQPGQTYEVDTTPIAPGGNRTFGCHTHADPTYATITIL